jgi:MarR family transcriptional regulator, organic hydroperoxide resistance regulator
MTRRKGEASPEGDSIAFLMRDTYGAFARSFQEELSRAGMTMSMWFFVRALAKEEGLSQTQLMERAGLLQPATSAALKQMAEMGLIVRKEDPSDRRMARFFLTAKSRALLKKLFPAAARVRDRAVVDFTAAELDQLRTLLRRMKTNLENGGGEL